MTNKMDYAIEVQVSVAESPTDNVFTSIADAFFALGGVSDQDVAASDAVLAFSMTVQGVDEVDALSTAMVAVRTSIHAAGGATPGWEAGIEMLRTVIEKEASPELV